MFRDITPLLASPSGLALSIELLAGADMVGGGRKDGNADGLFNQIHRKSQD